MPGLLKMQRRAVLIGEAPLVDGAVPFAPGTATRSALAALLNVPEAVLEEHVELRNALATAQPPRGWGRAFDLAAARRAIVAMHAATAFGGADVVFLGWRVAAVARPCLRHLPLLRGVWGTDGRGGRAAWVRHPAYKAASLAEMRRDWLALGLAA